MYKPWNGHLEGEQPYLGDENKPSLLIHHFLTGMILQEGGREFTEFPPMKARTIAGY